MMRVERAGALAGPADGPNTTNAQKPIHNATPVQTRVVVMMCSRETRQESLAVICANQGSPEEYGSRLQFQALRVAKPVKAAGLRALSVGQIASPRALSAALRIAAILVL